MVLLEDPSGMNSGAGPCNTFLESTALADGAEPGLRRISMILQAFNHESDLFALSKSFLHFIIVLVIARQSIDGRAPLAKSVQDQCLPCLLRVVLCNADTLAGLRAEAMQLVSCTASHLPSGPLHILAIPRPHFVVPSQVWKDNNIVGLAVPGIQ